MSRSPVKIEHDGPVCVITINRPDKRNAVDRATAIALRDAFSAFESDDDLAVAILTGASGNFCAGADLEAMDDPERRNAIDPEGTGPGPMGPVPHAARQAGDRDRARLRGRRRAGTGAVLRYARN